MIRQVTLSLLAVGLLTALPLLAQDDAPAAAPDGTYDIDPAHTSLYFHVGHFGISQVHGRFNDFAGTFTLGDQNSFQVTIQTASVDTGVDQRDNHLRSPDFFDARQFPEITFQTTSVEKDGDQYTLTGDFTMHGQTKPISLPLTCGGSVEAQGQQRVGFYGTTTIDRRDWGITGFEGAVGDEVTLMISFEGVKQ